MSSDNVAFWQSKIDEYTRLMESSEKNRDKRRYKKLLKQAQRELNQAQRIQGKTDSGFYTAEAQEARMGGITKAIGGAAEAALSLLGGSPPADDGAQIRPVDPGSPREEEPEGLWAQIQALPTPVQVAGAGALAGAAYLLLNRK